MKNLYTLFIVLMITFVGGIAIAQDVSAGEITEALSAAIHNWQSFGWIAGIAGIVGFLLLLLRYKRIDEFLTKKELKWIKPYLALVLGMIAGFFSTYATGEGWVESIMAGVLAGLVSPSLHLLLTKGNTK